MDGYTWVSAYTIDPYKKICRIRYDDYGTTGVATGFLVGPNLLLTSAHAVMNLHDNDANYAEWVALPAYHEGVSYNNLSSGYTDLFYTENYKDSHQVADDWCLCVLNNALGDIVGWMGCSYYTSSELGYITIMSDGYNVPEGNGEWQYVSAGKITSTYNRYYFSDAENTTGMDGGPAIWFSNFYAVGINNSIYNLALGSTGTYTSINLQVLSIINSYLN